LACQQQLDQLDQLVQLDQHFVEHNFEQGCHRFRLEPRQIVDIFSQTPHQKY
jgi:hypothetical protein